MTPALAAVDIEGDGRLVAHPTIRGSVDGWAARYLYRTSTATAPPTRGDVDGPLLQLILPSASPPRTSPPFPILAISNCGIHHLHFLNLKRRWIHRIDSGHVRRPWKAPTAVLAAGLPVLAFVNAGIDGRRDKVWKPNARGAG